LLVRCLTACRLLLPDGLVPHVLLACFFAILPRHALLVGVVID
jgi:hypothetical protein